MKIELGEEMKRGGFTSAEETIVAALLPLQHQEDFPDEDLEHLRDEIKVGLEELDRGEYAEFTAEDIIAEGRAAMNAKKKVS